MARNRRDRVSRRDYTVRDLPRTRLQLFWLTLRTHFGSMFLLNVLNDVFCLPVWAWSLYNYMVLLEMDDPAEFTTSGYFLIFLLVLVPLLTVTGPAKAAVKFVARNWARDDHASVFTDFVDALKDNWKRSLLFAGINSLVVLLAGVSIAFYGGMYESTLSGIYIFLQYFVIMLSVLWAMVNIYLWPMMITYDMLIRDLLRNSIILLLGQLPRSLLFGLLSVVPVGLMLFSQNLLVMIIGALYYVLFGLAITSFINASYTNYLFDKYFTPQILGESVNKGMYTPDDEDEDGDEDD